MIFNIDKWMHPAHCIPSAFFRYNVISSGLLVGVMYFIFAAVVFFGLKSIMRNFIEPKFAHYLGWVFVFCGLSHGIHGLKYLHQYFQVPLLFIYPCLIYYHIRLLISSIKAYKYYKKGIDFKSFIKQMFN